MGLDIPNSYMLRMHKENFYMLDSKWPHAAILVLVGNVVIICIL